jgi:head-tail adaptor
MAPRSKPVAQELRHRVTFQSRGGVDDGFGNEVSGGFEDRFSVHAAFRPGGGSEAVIAARLEGRQVLHVYVRASANTRMITPGWRMKSTNKGVQTLYAIDAVDPVTDPGWVYLQVESGVAA